MTFLNTTDTGLLLNQIGGLAIGLPALLAPKRLHEIWIPHTPYTEGLQSVLQILGATFLAGAAASFFIKRTEDIDSKRAFLQGASIFSWIAGYVAFISRSLWDPLAFKVVLGSCVFGGFSNVFYGCLCTTERA